MTLVLVITAIAGGVGAALRYLVDTAAHVVLPERFPWGILIVNVTGSFALGVAAGLVSASVAGSWIVGVGLVGGYTTFSAVAVTTVLLAEDGRTRAATGNALGTAVATAAAAAVGVWLTTLAS